MSLLNLLPIALSAASLALSLLALRRIAKRDTAAGVTPAATGGPRPKPAGTDEPDMEAQATGGPRPKV